MEINEKRKYIYRNSERGHEVSIIELVIVQLVCDLHGIENVVPPQLVLSVHHGKWEKHKQNPLEPTRHPYPSSDSVPSSSSRVPLSQYP